MTDGEWHHPVARQGPALQLKSMPQIHARLFCGQELFIPAYLTTGACASKFAFRRIFRGRHRPAGDLSHMFSGIRKLTPQKL